ncbi:MAG: Uma2 family endonuclease [Spirosomaceae bacterium]|jgi:Uma2 family endonuclease|nr:Uma2 family endonuclease [Spirosomataceae bacterium]
MAVLLEEIPESLLVEEIDGVPFYRKGYKDVLLGLKEQEEIMGSSKLQSFIIAFIVKFLNRYLPNDLDVVSSESGLHLSTGSNLATDIAIYNINEVGNIFETVYFDTPPKVVIEVDVKVDLEKNKISETAYIKRKTKKMLNFGVEKVVWILTATQTVIIADANQSDWRMTDFGGEIDLMNDIRFSIKQLIEERGFQLPALEN